MYQLRPQKKSPSPLCRAENDGGPLKKTIPRKTGGSSCCQVCDYEPGEFIHTLGDTHIYSNHFDQVKEQLSRTPRKLPTMKLNPAIKDLFEFKFEDFELVDYDPWPTIKAPIAV